MTAPLAILAAVTALSASLMVFTAPGKMWSLRTAPLTRCRLRMAVEAILCRVMLLFMITAAMGSPVELSTLFRMVCTELDSLSKPTACSPSLVPVTEPVARWLAWMAPAAICWPPTAPCAICAAWMPPLAAVSRLLSAS